MPTQNATQGLSNSLGRTGSGSLSEKWIDPRSIRGIYRAMSEEEAGSVEEQLLLACQNGDAGTLQTITSSVPGLDLSMATEDGVTLLMQTIIGAGTGANPEGFYPETCQLLLQTPGLRLDTADLTYGRTAAHWAVAYQRHDLLEQLITAGTDMTTPDFDGLSVFHLTISERASLCLELCIKVLPREILEFPDGNGRSPLVHAVQIGNVEACQLLVAARASVNAMDQITGQFPLHIAAQNGNVAIVELLLQNEAVLDLSDANGMTPIHLASIMGAREALEVMVKLAGAAVLSLPDASGVTPLMYACAYGNETLTKYLLKKKVEVSDRDIQGKTALHWAAECPQESGSKCVQMLLKKHKDLIESMDDSGRTPLLYAAMSGQADSINILLSAGASIGHVDKDMHTAAHWATVSGQPQALLAVLSAGGSISSPDNQGAYPIHYAAQECKEPLEEEYTDKAQLHSVNMQECLKLIMERDGDTSCRDAQGMTPLHWALQFPNNLVACSLLLANGADPKAKDNDGQTGLHVSARQGLTENCQFLLDHTGGSIATELDNQGQSALFSAVESGQLECVEYLLKINLSPTLTNVEGRSPVHVASTIGFLACLQLLQAYRADLTASSVHGATAMHEAAANGHRESLEYLLTCGCHADDHAGPTGATALHYAVTAAHGECVHILLNYGANVNAVVTSEEGERLTPLDYCSDYPEMVDYLRGQGAMLGAEIYPAEAEEEVDAAETEEADAAKAQEDQRLGVTWSKMEPDDVIVDQSEARNTAVTADPSEARDTAVTADQSEVRDTADRSEDISGEVVVTTPRETKEGVVIARTSRPSTADRKIISWQGVGGGRGEGEKEGGEEEGKMRRPSQQSLEGVGMEAIRLQAGKPAPRLLERTLNVLRGGRPPPPSSSILSSVVGFYAAHATILAAAVIGTLVGSKVTEVSEKVATDTADDLKQAAGTFEGDIPDLVWLHEKPPSRIPTPVITVLPPTPLPPSPPPTPEITFDPFDRRMRKAKAQMDMTKSTGYRAVEELLKAQATHMALKKQFEVARVTEMTLAQREAFAAEEAREREQADAVLRRLDKRIKKADKESEQVHEALDQQLQSAREENEKIRQLMGEMGVSTRPTVSEWLKQKNQQKKRDTQEALISWDRSKQRRETAILVQQMLTSQRAMKHAAWGASKDISAKIRAMKEEELLGSTKPARSKPAPMPHSPRKFPRPPTYREREPAAKPVNKLQGPPIKRSPSVTAAKKKASAKSPPSVSSSVRATPQGFLKIRDPDVTMATPSPRQQATPSEPNSEEMWHMGRSYARGKFNPARLPRTATPAYIRATGPKQAHTQRTLHFLPPEQYHAEKQQQRAQRNKLMKEFTYDAGLEEEVVSPPAKSFLAMQSLQFGGREVTKREGRGGRGRGGGERGRRASFGNSTAQYHSLADSMGGRNQLAWKQKKRASSVEIPVLPMSILKPSPLSTPSPVNC